MIAIVAAVFVLGFALGCRKLVDSILDDAEQERRDLARDASPCTQTLTRYQP